MRTYYANRDIIQMQYMLLGIPRKMAMRAIERILCHACRTRVLLGAELCGDAKATLLTHTIDDADQGWETRYGTQVGRTDVIKA